MDPEELPTWVAYPAGACAPEEGSASTSAARMLLEAVTTYVGLVALCTHLDRPPGGPDVRPSMKALLDGCGWLRALRLLPESEHAGIAAALDLLGRGPGPDASNSYRDMAHALISVAPEIARWSLCHVRSLRPDGQRLELRYRVLSGTAWPAARVRQLDRLVPLVEGDLCLWDGADRYVPVPRWLGWYDDDKALLRLIDGPDGRGNYTYRTTHPGGTTLRVPLPAGAPTYLLVPEAVDDPGSTTEVLTFEELTSGGIRAVTTDLRTIVLVISGRSMLAYRELLPDRAVVVGRSAEHADLVVHHSKVSRRNTQICMEGGELWVRDLDSTNGTRLRGQPVGSEPVRVELGDVLQVGPAMIRIDQVGAYELDKLDRILRYSTEPGRDPLTGLLELSELPSQLARMHLPDARPLVAIVIELDQLSTIKSERGADLADLVWVNVARLVLLALDDPSLCTVLGYGELLVVLPGGDGARLADAVQEELAQHAWVPPLDVTVTAAVVRVEPDEPIDDWIERARQLALLGRARRGPGRVHGVGRG